MLLDPGCREPEIPSAHPDNGETESPPAEQLRSPRVATASGGPARAPPYQEPSWGRPATAPYSLETLKGGTILGTGTLKGMSCCLFGRLTNCDICLEHPSVSRYYSTGGLIRTEKLTVMGRASISMIWEVPTVLSSTKLASLPALTVEFTLGTSFALEAAPGSLSFR